MTRWRAPVSSWPEWWWMAMQGATAVRYRVARDGRWLAREAYCSQYGRSDEESALKQYRVGALIERARS